jgi:hypothetical protein
MHNARLRLNGAVNGGDNVARRDQPGKGDSGADKQAWRNLAFHVHSLLLPEPEKHGFFVFELPAS